MNVVGFLHAYRVLWETIHDLSQIAVYLAVTILNETYY